ncbi:CRISPR system precrRNA processing endoribonuclease RAMP protein Cas6 [Frankia sp. AgB1.9]|uniref:CRISPR system precrRNA processing endoribonuclease RAMP protein Cas6 n=1 Tax=unclassified Frankia TaxID=2632575 RepID=UPI00193469C5|nr:MULTISPECIES: CRISPR system precrRNA processing endoribonuclease RAMP protein Cas6 [unclassified Frankia]MBL7487427.1 CRISPR system precrRNA processing endoribonuclease RAMP protein Cas6 [Frankia sp. AgW1.1]MBL7551055.1 CRISPR system precrRNA processing endoribonuclease RAMP protein Cas6 [Frankia sp. AgB1.9]MBL7618836.1 CRISPR system precrRNA processing endoribonuclease RAMP protein Cas6 [Frankia sp. AgB1.8]
MDRRGWTVPARIVVRLEADSSGAPPPQTGPGVAAAVLAAVAAVDPALARRLHDDPPPKPYRLTPLLDEHHQPPRRSSQQIRFEVGILVDALFAGFHHALSNATSWRIGTTAYQPAGIDIAALLPYPDLASESAPASSWGFQLVTPCGFGTAREEGARRRRVFPEPEWVFTSLAQRWRANAPALRTADGGAFDLAGAVEAAERNLQVVEFELRTAEHLVKPRVPPLRGAVGTIRYALAEAASVSMDARHALSTLAAYATYAGLGDRTTVGMGYVLPLPALGPPSGTRLAPAATSGATRHPSGSTGRPRRSS